MNVIVETSVWLLAFRSGATRGTPEEMELRALIDEGRVVMLGPIRQNLLSGIRSPPQFDNLRTSLRAFPDLALDEADFEGGAACFRRCRSHRLARSSTDFLVCSVALRHDFAIFTADEDFAGLARELHVRLHRPR